MPPVLSPQRADQEPQNEFLDILAAFFIGDDCGATGANLVYVRVRQCRKRARMGVAYLNACRAM